MIEKRVISGEHRFELSIPLLGCSLLITTGGWILRNHAFVYGGDIVAIRWCIYLIGVSLVWYGADALRVVLTKQPIRIVSDLDHIVIEFICGKRILLWTQVNTTVVRRRMDNLIEKVMLQSSSDGSGAIITRRIFGSAIDNVALLVANRTEVASVNVRTFEKGLS